MIKPSEQTWFGQPRGLTILFLTEMWSFFSYYGMRTLLVYYMTKHLLFGQEKSSFIYGSYTATAYLMPIFGGIAADRWLGKRKAVIAGGSIMAIGHFMMAFESLFYPALCAIAVGNGLFVPSLPSQINDLYEGGDPRRGSTIYMKEVIRDAAVLTTSITRGSISAACSLRSSAERLAKSTAGTMGLAQPGSECLSDWLST